MHENMKQRTEYSIVVLCYGSGAKIPAFVENTIKLLLANDINDYELVLVGNYLENHVDNAATIVQQLAKGNSRIIAVAKKKEGMMGWDMRAGLAAATGNYISVIDGDGQMPIEDLVRVYQKIRNENYDVVKTVRIKRSDGIYRKIVSNIFNVFFRLLFPSAGSKDINSKPKIFSRQTYEKFDLRSNDWFVDAEIMIQARRLGLKIGEVPTSFDALDREEGTFIGFFTFLEFIKNLIQFRLIEFWKDRR